MKREEGRKREEGGMEGGRERWRAGGREGGIWMEGRSDNMQDLSSLMLCMMSS